MFGIVLIVQAHWDLGRPLRAGTRGLLQQIQSRGDEKTEKRIVSLEKIIFAVTLKWSSLEKSRVDDDF